MRAHEAFLAWFADEITLISAGQYEAVPKIKREAGGSQNLGECFWQLRNSLSHEGNINNGTADHCLCFLAGEHSWAWNNGAVTHPSGATEPALHLGIRWVEGLYLAVYLDPHVRRRAQEPMRIIRSDEIAYRLWGTFIGEQVSEERRKRLGRYAVENAERTREIWREMGCPIPELMTMSMPGLASQEVPGAWDPVRGFHRPRAGRG
ncbi:MAG: hypothetical protein ACTS27_03690 [Phycisphaerales bacterium]